MQDDFLVSVRHNLSSFTGFWYRRSRVRARACAHARKIARAWALSVSPDPSLRLSI